MITKPLLGAIYKVLIHNININNDTVTTNKTDIEHTPIKQNKRNFTDVYSLPFLQEPLYS